MKLSYLNDDGIDEFRFYLNGIRSGDIEDLDRKNLLSTNFSNRFEIDIEISEITTDEKSEFIIELYNVLKDIDIQNNFYNTGLWSWLSVFYFELVCPKKDNIRKPGADDRHILNPNDWRRYYRHLIAAPIRLYFELGKLAVGYLDGSPDKHGEFFEQLASTQEIATSPGIIEAAILLFWDPEKQEFKRGSRGKNGPGTIRRFARDIIPQFQMTYDLNSMSGSEIIELLPTEFDIWK